jgi:cytochrome c5
MNKLCIALAVALATLAGCGRNDSTATAPPTSDPAAPGPTAAQTPAPTPAQTAADTAAQNGGASPAQTAAAPAADATATMGAGPDTAGGQAVFAKTCVVCHGAGVAGAPRLGDKADWSPRVAQGKNVLYQHALQGYTGKKGVMPPKGGNTTLSDADVKTAVDYMVAQAR